MKKTIITILILTMMFSLAACGRSEAAKAVDEEIKAIGEISLSSGSAIRAAEESFSALSTEEKDSLHYAKLLASSKELYVALLFSGDWVEPDYSATVDIRSLYARVDLHIEGDGSFRGNGSSGSWTASYDSLALSTGEVYTLSKDDSGRDVLQSGSKSLLRVEDYRAELDKLYVTVPLSLDNVRDYCALALGTMPERNQAGEPTGVVDNVLYVTSKARSSGLVFLGATYDSSVTLAIPAYHSLISFYGGEQQSFDNPASSVESDYGVFGKVYDLGYSGTDFSYTGDLKAEDCSFTAAGGTLVFLRSEYVEEVVPAGDGVGRVVKTVFGNELHSGSWYDEFDY